MRTLIGLALLAGCSGDGAGEDRAAATIPPATAPTEPAWSRSFDTTVEQPADLPGFNVYRPTDLGATGAPMPVIVWANGGCVRFDQPWAPLLRRWAETGFVVVAVTSPAGTEPGRGNTASAQDQAAAIDWAFAADEDPGSPFHGHLDRERVIAAGNSCGGITSLQLTARDPRVGSAFVLSGSSVPPGSTAEQAAEVMEGVTVPVAWVTGGPEDIAVAMATQDLSLVADGVPALLARRSHADHATVSTDAAILGEVAEISVNWFDAVLNGNEAALDTLLRDPCAACADGLWSVETRGAEPDR